MSNKSISRLKVKNNWWEIFQGNTKRIFESRILPKYIKTCRWFGSKALNIKRINIVENILIGEDKSDARLLFLNVEYFKNIKEMYLLPITFSQSEERTDKTIAYLNTSSKKGRIFDAVNEKKFQNYYSIPDNDKKTPTFVQELIGKNYINMIKILGKRTGELHLALSSDSSNNNFTPEQITYNYQKSVVFSMKNLTKKVFGFLKGHYKNINRDLKNDADNILQNEKRIMEYYEKLLKKRISATKIRIHDDYHLGQVLYTGKDFVIIDFEGEPARMLKERRLKKSPIKDISGMLRSFHYATYNALFIQSLSEKNVVLLEPWADIWYECISRVFLNSYFKTVKNASFIPKKKEDTETLLNAFLIEKAVYELGYELNNRPDWVIIPLKALRHFTK